MKTIEIKLYQFNELSEEAKKRAIDFVRESRWEYDWGGDAILSLESFLSALGTYALNYDIDWHNPYKSFVKVDHSEIDLDFEFGPDYHLTGYCMDYPLMETWDKTKDIDQAIEAWLKDCANDYEYQISDEGIAEFAINNEYDFNEYGYGKIY